MLMEKRLGQRSKVKGQSCLRMVICIMETGVTILCMAQEVSTIHQKTTSTKEDSVKEKSMEKESFTIQTHKTFTMEKLKKVNTMEKECILMKKRISGSLMSTNMEN